MANVHGVPIIVPIIVAESQEFTMITLLAATNRLNNLAPEQALAEIYRYNNLAPEQKLAEVYRLNNRAPDQLSSSNSINHLVHSATTPICSPSAQLHYNSNFTAIADTGASHHYCHANAPVPQRDYHAPTTVVGLADGDVCKSIATATLDLPDLPPGTTSCHIMPSFVNNLLSMGVFCNADCSVTFTKHTATVTNKAGLVILTGFCETTGARLW